MVGFVCCQAACCSSCCRVTNDSKCKQKWDGISKRHLRGVRRLSLTQCCSCYAPYRSSLNKLTKTVTLRTHSTEAHAWCEHVHATMDERAWQLMTPGTMLAAPLLRRLHTNIWIRVAAEMVHTPTAAVAAASHTVMWRGVHACMHCMGG